MTSMDHTARARLQVRNEPSSPPDTFADTFAGQRSPLGLGLEKFDHFTAKLASISLAINVVQALLERSEASKQPNAPRNTRVPWPFNPVQTTALQAAVHLLQQYADTLDPEPGG